MGTVTSLSSGHPLVGTWRPEQDDFRSEYSVQASLGGLVVTGRDFVDGEAYVISDVTWSDRSVEFKTYMPSTGRRGLIILQAVRSMNSATMTFTFTDTCMMVKHTEGGSAE